MHALKAENIKALGGKCQAEGCTTTDPKHLQFAHLKPTGLAGSGRGMGHRLYDVKNNPESYTLLCDGGCHEEFDAGAISVRAHGKVWLQNAV